MASGAGDLDEDGDGIPFAHCLVPITHWPPTLRRHWPQRICFYSERSEDWEQNLIRLRRKFDTARTMVPQPLVDEVEEAKIAIISLGSNDESIAEARDRLRNVGIEVSYLRLTGTAH
ncbi:MAG: hypothetical protein R2867_23805 [Caldilineaceae bacterium]